MKTLKLYIAITFMLITSIVVAKDGETDNRENMMFGFKAGVNYSNVYDSRTDDFEADAKLGFAGGIFLSIPLNMYIGLQPELLLSQKGFKGSGVMFGSEYKFSRTTTYIDVPLQFTLKPSEFITILAGPQYSYLINQKDQFESSLVSYSQEEEFENDNIRKNIIGVGAGLDINLMQFIVSTRLGWDLTRNHGDGSSSTPRYKNAWFQATLGYTM